MNTDTDSTYWLEPLDTYPEQPEVDTKSLCILVVRCPGGGSVRKLQRRPEGRLHHPPGWTPRSQGHRLRGQLEDARLLRTLAGSGGHVRTRAAPEAVGAEEVWCHGVRPLPAMSRSGALRQIRGQVGNMQLFPLWSFHLAYKLVYFVLQTETILTFFSSFVTF